MKICDDMACCILDETGYAIKDCILDISLTKKEKNHCYLEWITLTINKKINFFEVTLTKKPWVQKCKN